MQIAERSVVSIHYTLTDAEGEVIDSSAGGSPLVYLHGAGNIITGLESALVGRKAGDTLKVEVAPADGYGEHDPRKVQEVPREAFQGVDQIDVGMRFQAQGNHGPISVVVTAVSSDLVTVDGNHPLAGQTLFFDVEITAVREASEEKLAHGHVHGDGGHHH